MLVLTGASHTGKTAVANRLLETLPPPAAFLSVDDVLSRVLRRASGQIWSHIPLAYEILTAELGPLLGKGWFVIVESTFTYVSPTGEGEFHAEALERLVAAAEECSAPAFVAQLSAPENVVLKRAERAGRLDKSIVSRTVALHKSIELPLDPYLVDAGRLDPEQSADKILRWLRAETSSQAN